MRRLAPFAAALALGACGAPAARAPLGAAFDIRGLAPGSAGFVQLTVLNDTAPRSCAQIVKSCLSDQVSRDDVVPVVVGGREYLSLLIAVSEPKLAGDGDRFTAEIAEGQGYTIVAEVLSPDKARLVASGCLEGVTVSSASDAPATLTITATALTPPPACDPLVRIP